MLFAEWVDPSYERRFRSWCTLVAQKFGAAAKVEQVSSSDVAFATCSSLCSGLQKSAESEPLAALLERKSLNPALVLAALKRGENLLL